jgi:hypothetical protein
MENQASTIIRTFDDLFVGGGASIGGTITRVGG